MPLVESDGVRIRFEIAGQGPPLVLHPGFVGTVENWIDAGYVAALKDRFQLIMLDPRGQGQSDRPHDQSAYTRHQRTGDVLAVLDALEINRAHYWGYSMGGWIGFELGAAAPDRLLSLIIGGSAAFAGNPRPADGDVWLDGLRRGMETLVLQWEESVDDFWITPREREQWLASDADALTAARRQRLIEPDLSEQAVSAIRLPALIYAGTNDAPEEVERSARLMPDATFLPLEGLNHAQAFTRSDLLVPTVLEFLEQIEETKSLRS